MTVEFHMIWRDQVGAVSAIRQQHGEEAAFDYIVAEKLMNFAEAAEERPAFARELPRFVAAIREAFPLDMMQSGLQRVARYLEEDKADAADMLREKQGNPPSEVDGGDGNDDTDDAFEDAEMLARRIQSLSARQRRFEFLRDLLISERLGTA
jgi:ubiquinone biosynthesis protein UbiJ